MAAQMFGVMRWINDNNRLSVHNLKYILEPDRPISSFRPGDCGLAVFPGFPGRWTYRLLAVGGKKEMKIWLDANITKLMIDVTDTNEEVLQKRPETSELSLAKSPKQLVTTVKESTTPKKSTSPKELTSQRKSTTPKKSSPPRELTTPRKFATPRKSSSTPKSLKKSEPGQRSSFNDYMKKTSLSTSDKRIRRLEDEVHSMKKKIRRLEEFHRTASKKEGRTENFEVASSPENTTVDAPLTVAASASEARSEVLKADLQKLITSSMSEQEIFKQVTFKVFNQDELRDCSRTGKRSIKNMETPRPPINQEKLENLKGLIQKFCPAMNNEMFIKKFENLQKVLRRK